MMHNCSQFREERFLDQFSPDVIHIDTFPHTLAESLHLYSLVKWCLEVWGSTSVAYTEGSLGNSYHSLRINFFQNQKLWTNAVLRHVNLYLPFCFIVFSE